MKATLTAHFVKRCKERAGFNKTGAKAFANNALNRGKNIESFESYPAFYTYLKSIDKEDFITIIYGEFILFFSKTYTAITIIRMPSKYNKYLVKENKNAKRRFFITEEDSW